MQLIIHLGLNKAASTWLQHSLAANKSPSIYYDNYHEYYLNHHLFYRLLKEGSKTEAGNWLSSYVEKASLRNAFCAVVSSEDIWQELPLNDKTLATLLETTEAIKEKKGIDTRFLLINRSFKKWAFSYCMQLMANIGGLSQRNLDDLFRSSLNISQFALKAANSLPASALDVIACDESNFPKRLSSIIGPSFEGLPTHLNVTRSGSIGMKIFEGSLRTFYSFAQGADSNSKEIDLLIQEFETECDKLLEAQSTNEAKHVFEHFDATFRELINNEIGNCISSMGENEKIFWNCRNA